MSILFDKGYSGNYNLIMEPEKIIEMRKSLGLSQESFAHRVGVSWVTVNRWENGYQKPSPLAVEKILRVQSEEMRRKDRLASV
jgi:DNA-binding transcriptional regulator YiaG